jgi:hypothetical protein
MPSQIELAEVWVRDEAEIAESKKGGHDTTFKTVCTLLHGFDLGDADLMSVLGIYNATKCLPPWTEAELQHKLSGARTTSSRYPKGWLYRKICREKGYWKPGMGSRGPAGSSGQREMSLEHQAPKYEAKWRLPFDLDALRAMQPAGVRVDEAWLAARSPVDVATCTTADFLNAVFDREDMVLVFTKFGSQGQYMWWRGRAYLLASRAGIPAQREVKLYGGKVEPVVLPKGGPEGVWYLSQPVNGKWMPNPREIDPHTKKPKLSRRSEESVTKWKHLVLEADPVEEVKKDPALLAEFEMLWLGFLAKLPLPIKAIYTSGGKSTHALVSLPCDTKERFDATKRLLGPLFSKLGADPAAMKAVQLTRLPGCKRGERLQKLLYLNPQPDPSGVPLIEMAVPKVVVTNGEGGEA